MNTVVVFVAQYLIFVIGACFLAYGLLKIPREQRLVYFANLAVAIVIGVALAKLASALHTSPRPFVIDGSTPMFSHAATNGFPSSHMVAGGIVALLIWRYNKKLSIVLFGMALAIGLARVMANVHHLQDIVAGTVIAVIAVADAHYIIEYLVAKMKRERGKE